MKTLPSIEDKAVEILAMIDDEPLPVRIKGLAHYIEADRANTIKAVREMLEEVVGKKCDTYEKECPTCEIWKALDQLEDLNK